MSQWIYLDGKAINLANFDQIEFVTTEQGDLTAMLSADNKVFISVRGAGARALSFWVTGRIVGPQITNLDAEYKEKLELVNFSKEPNER